MPQIPAWIQAADPLAATVQGFHVGSQIGAQQAAQRFQEQQMLRKQQEDEMAKAQWEAEFGLKASEAARKHEAMQQYQRRIAAGEDAMKVILELGPQIGGQGAAEAAIIRSQHQRPAPTWRPVELPGGIQTVQSDQGGLRFVPREKPAAMWEEVERGGVKGQRNTLNDRFIPYPAPRGGMTETQRLLMADRYQREISEVLADPNLMGVDLKQDSPDPTWSPRKKNAFTTAKARISELTKKKENLEFGPSAGNVSHGTKRLRFDPDTGDMVEVK